MTLLYRLSQWLCFHHDTMLKREPGHVCVQCLQCGHQSEGWVLDLPSPRRVW
jgi:hypothetical protein